MRAGGERRHARAIGPPRLVALVGLSAACAPDDLPPTAGQLLPEGVDMVQQEMRTVVTREGIRRAVVEGETAEWHGENEVHLSPMNILFYDVNGVPSTEVVSDFGIYDELTGDLEAQGNVVAEDHVDGQRLETERMRYANAEGRLYGPVEFRLSRAVGTMLVEGTSFESDPGLDSVIVLNPEGETRPQLVTLDDMPADSAPAPGDTAVAADSEAGVAADAELSDALPAAADDPAADPATGAEEPASAADDPAVDPDLEAAGTAVAAPDSMAVEDPAAAASDSAAAPSDPVVAPPDTAMALPDTATALPDTATVLPDTAVTPPDTAAVQDTTGAPPDTTAHR